MWGGGIFLLRFVWDCTSLFITVSFSVRGLRMRAIRLVTNRGASGRELVYVRCLPGGKKYGGPVEVLCVDWNLRPEDCDAAKGVLACTTTQGLRIFREDNDGFTLLCNRRAPSKCFTHYCKWCPRYGNVIATGGSRRLVGEGGSGGIIRLLKFEGGRFNDTKSFKVGDGETVYELSWESTGKYLIAAAQDVGNKGNPKLYILKHASTSRVTVSQIIDHPQLESTEDVVTAQFHPSEALFISMTGSEILVWLLDKKASKWFHTYSLNFKKSFSCATFDTTGDYVAICRWDGCLRVWKFRGEDINSMQGMDSIARRDISEDLNYALSLDWKNDTVAVADERSICLYAISLRSRGIRQDQKIQLLHKKSGQTHFGGLTCVKINPEDPSIIASAADDGYNMIWSLHKKGISSQHFLQRNHHKELYYYNERGRPEYESTSEDDNRSIDPLDTSEEDEPDAVAEEVALPLQASPTPSPPQEPIYYAHQDDSMELVYVRLLPGGKEGGGPVTVFSIDWSPTPEACDRAEAVLACATSQGLRIFRVEEAGCSLICNKRAPSKRYTTCCKWRPPYGATIATGGSCRVVEEGSSFMGSGGIIRLLKFDGAYFKNTKSFKVGDGETISELSWDLEGKYLLATVQNAGNPKLYIVSHASTSRVRMSQIIDHPPLESSDDSLTAKFHPSSPLFISMAGRQVWVWDYNQKYLKWISRDVMINPTANSPAVTFDNSTGRDYVAACGRDGRLGIWKFHGNQTDMQLMDFIARSDTCGDLEDALSIDWIQNTIVVADKKSICFYSASELKNPQIGRHHEIPLLHKKSGQTHFGGLKCVKINPEDPTIIASAAEDGYTMIWSFRMKGINNRIYRPRNHWKERYYYESERPEVENYDKETEDDQQSIDPLNTSEEDEEVTST